MFRIDTIAFVSFLSVLSTGAVLAQQVTGNIVGTVLDPTGAPVAAATVKAVNDLTGETHSTRTNATGDYLLPGLPVSRYRIEVEVAGFKKYVQQRITLDVNQNARVDPKLELGQISQQVVVQGGATLVDTREVQLGGIVDEKRVIDLPLNGRDVYSLATLLPGITGTPSLPTQPTVGAGTQLNINGARVLQTTYLFDGGLNVGTNRNGGLLVPNPDSVEEFQLITSNFNAEYGRSAGGVVTVVTKSGTNQIHGSLFEFLRNDDLDSRSFFAPSVTPLKRNEFGGTVGGPVIHDKLFYFFSYEGDRLNQGIFDNAARTPTAAERGGDFSAVAASQRPADPTTGQPFPGGIIPANRLDPVAQNMLKLVVLPNAPDGRWQGTGSGATPDNQYFGKADYQATSNHRASGGLFFIRSQDTYPFGNASNSAANVPGFAATGVANQTNVTVNETWTARPTLLNQFTFNYAFGQAGVTALSHLSWPDFGSKFVPAELPAQIPQLVVNGGWTSGSPGETYEKDSVYSFADSATWIRGAHSVKVGGSLQLLHMDYIDRYGLGGSASISSALAGNAFADMELGMADSLAVRSGNEVHLRSQNWAGFIQDNWKVSRKVTLNLGLRYEVFTPYTNQKNRIMNFILGEQSTVYPTAPRGLVYPGDPGVPSGVVNTDYNNIAPRLGIAIDPFGDGKTAVRAGFGIFYSVGYANFSQFNANGSPFEDNLTVYGTPSFVNPFANAGGNPFPVPAGTEPFILPITVSWLDQKHRTPYVEAYNFTIQRQLRRDLNFDVAYVGNVSRKLQMLIDFNDPIYIPGQSTAANVNARRPISPGVFGSIGQLENAANASFNSLQTTLRRHFTQGFTLLANYTYSKSIDLQDADSQNFTPPTFEDSRNVGLDRGVAAFDRRHVFNLSFLWQPPKIRRWGFVGKKLLSDWQVNAIARYASGAPFTVTSGVDTNLDGVNNDRPNTVADPYLDTGRSKSQRLAKYFNPTAFAVAATGTDGNAGRGIIYGPGSANWDVSFFKNVPIWERHQLQFRAELFNFLNHANFGNPVSALSNPNKGQILSAGAGRIIQFGLKYWF